MEEWTQPQTTETPVGVESAPVPAAGFPATPDEKQPPASKSGLKKKVFLGAAGVGILALTAGVLFQVFSGEGAIADEETGGDVRKSMRPQYVARVNQEHVTWDEVAEECVQRYGREVLDSLINRKIVQQACKSRGIEVTNQEVAKEITRIASNFNMPVETWYQMLQAERNLTPVQYQRDIIWPMLALKKLAGTQIKITNDDIHKAYVKQYGPRAKVKVLMLDNLKKATRLHGELLASKQATAFETTVREHSVEPNSRALDGSIPPIHRYYPNTKLEEAAFRLQKGQISGVIEVGVKRYVILKSEGFTQPKEVALKDVQGELYQQLQENRVQELVAKTFNSLKKQSRIDNYLTNVTSGGSIQPASGTQQPGQVKPAEGIYRTQPTPTTNQQSPFTQKP